MKHSELAVAQALVRRRLSNAGIDLDPNRDIEVTDFGLGHWAHTGLGTIIRVKQPEYCSKYLTLEPGQEYPPHFHKLKKETLLVLDGEVKLCADEQTIMLIPGESFTILPGVVHTFDSLGGAVMEEVSTHDESGDSYFKDAAIVPDMVTEEDV